MEKEKVTLLSRAKDVGVVIYTVVVLGAIAWACFVGISDLVQILIK